MLKILSVKDLGNDWSGFAKIWEVEFNGIPFTVSKQNTVGVTRTTHISTGHIMLEMIILDI